MRKLKMKKYLITLLAALTLSAALCVKAHAAEVTDTVTFIVEPEPADAVLALVTSGYADWESAEFNGKLIYDKLPIKPGVKIYMRRDSLLQISLRAPFLGEVGRLMINDRELLIVNKMKKKYCLESTENLKKIYPGLISDLQSLLLARAVVFGSGELSADNSKGVKVSSDNENGWMLIPEGMAGLIDMNYGYIVNAAGRTQAFMAAIPGHDVDLQVKYSYPGKGERMDVEFSKKGKSTDLSLEFNSVKWGGTPMPAMRLDRYERVGIKEFISSIR